MVESRRGRPRATCWLLARRSITDPTDIAYYLSDASGDTSLRTLASVAAACWTIEQCSEESKGEVGLDEYEVRYWQSWHHHITWPCWRMPSSLISGIRRGGKGGGRTGQTHDTRSVSVVRHRSAAPSPIHSATPDLVSLAPSQAAASAP